MDLLQNYILSGNSTKVYEYLENAIRNNNFSEVCHYIETLNGYMEMGGVFVKVNIEGNDLGNAYYNIANYIGDQYGNYELAIKTYKKALEYKKEDQIYNNLATAYKRLKRFDEALVNYEKAIELDKGNPIRYLRPALLHAFIGNNQKALEFSQKFFDKGGQLIDFNSTCDRTTQGGQELKKLYNNKEQIIEKEEDLTGGVILIIGILLILLFVFLFIGRLDG